MQEDYGSGIMENYEWLGDEWARQGRTIKRGFTS